MIAAFLYPRGGLDRSADGGLLCLVWVCPRCMAAATVTAVTPAARMRAALATAARREPEQAAQERLAGARSG